jgi:hypothetical protein
LQGKKTLIVEMGAVHTTVVVSSIDTVENGPVCVGAAHDSSLGSHHFDLMLFQHFAEVCLKKDGTKIEAGTKRGHRLLSGCERLRKLLSQLGDGKVTVENLTDAGDVNFSLKRDEMQTICEELLNRFKALLQSALHRAGIEADQIYAIEIVGGGARMPTVQAVLSGMFGADTPLGAKLDDGSVALGAALVSTRVATGNAPPVEGDSPVPETSNLTSTSVAASKFTDATGTAGLTIEEIAAARQREVEMEASDAKLIEVAAARNDMESFILEMRGAPRRKHGSKIDAGALDAVLNESESWMWDNMDATLEATNEQVLGHIWSEIFFAYVHCC